MAILLPAWDALFSRSPAQNNAGPVLVPEIAIIRSIRSASLLIELLTRMTLAFPLEKKHPPFDGYCSGKRRSLRGRIASLCATWAVWFEMAAITRATTASRRWECASDQPTPPRACCHLRPVSTSIVTTTYRLPLRPGAEQSSTSTSCLGGHAVSRDAAGLVLKLAS
jgi:hypothetical protein